MTPIAERFILGREAGCIYMGIFNIHLYAWGRHYMCRDIYYTYGGTYNVCGHILCMCMAADYVAIYRGLIIYIFISYSRYIINN